MGRPRKNNRHLPAYMYKHKDGVSYYFAKGKEYINLGSPLEKALINYSRCVDLDRNIVTIDDLIDDLLMELELGDHPDYKHLSKLTIDDYKKHFKRFRPVFGHMKPANLTKLHIYQYRDKRRSAPVQANREISSLQKLMEHAVIKGLANENPAKNIRKYPEKGRKRLPSQSDIESVQNVGDERIAAYIELKNLIGLRQGDMLELRWDCEIEEGLLVSISKAGGKKIIFAWNEKLRAALDRLKELQIKDRLNSDYIICNQFGKQYSSGGFRTRWRKARLKALASGQLTESFTEHDIRAKVATDITEAFGEDHAAKILVHADVKTTRKYIRNIPVVETAI